MENIISMMGTDQGIKALISFAHSGKNFARRTTYWINESDTWHSFSKRFLEPTRTPETVAEYLTMPKEKQDELKDVGGYVGGVCTGGVRQVGAVVDRQIVTLDVDHAGGVDIMSIVPARLNGVCAVVHTTRKHSITNGRYRIIIPLDRPVNKEEYNIISRSAAHKIGSEYFDQKTFEYERLMYFPSCSIDGEYFVKFYDGNFLNADDCLREYQSVLLASGVKGKTNDIIKQKTREKASAIQSVSPENKSGLIGQFCRAYTIHEAIEKFLPDVYTPYGSSGDRYTYTGGSTAGGLYVFNDANLCYSHHASDPIGTGHAVNAYDLVRTHLYGSDDDYTAPVHHRASTARMALLCESDPLVMRAEGAATADTSSSDLSWVGDLARDGKTGAIVKSVENFYLMLKNDPNLKGNIVYNSFDQSIYGKKSLPWERHSLSWTDADDKLLAGYIERVYSVYCREKLDIAVEKIVSEIKYHPIQDYLSALNWDGIKRVDTALIDYLGADDTLYTRAVTRKMLCAGVARAYDAGCKYDSVVSLLGAQGIGKSTFLRKLGRSWYSDSLVSLEGEPAMMALRGTWIVEIAEMSAKERARINVVKMFLSKQVDRYRPKYARREMDFPRQNIFIATTNDFSFLSDPTGNRRFLPIACGEKSVKSVFELDDYTVGQMWAEAVSYYRAGEPLYLPQDLDTVARETQSAHTAEPELVSVIKEFLSRPISDHWYMLSVDERIRRMRLPQPDHLYKRQFISVIEIWRECFGELSITPPKDRAIEIRNSLKFLGWKNAKKRIGAEYGHVNGFSCV